MPSSDFCSSFIRLNSALPLPNRPLTVAVLGASGAVGQELLQLLEERNFPVAELRLLASVRSAGSRCKWRGQELIVRETTAESFRGVDLVLASAGGSVSKTWREEIVASGALMVDNSNDSRKTNCFLRRQTANEPRDP